MKYNGIELEPITKPQIFDPPKEMLVWDRNHPEPRKALVHAITKRNFHPIVTDSFYYEFCSEIPEEPKPKRATNIQLMKWLTKGKGVWKYKDELVAFISISIHIDSLENEVDDVLIRPFGTTEWLEPILENMGMEDK